jgi:hypothetical protein
VTAQVSDTIEYSSGTGSMPIKTLAAQIRTFCATASL